MKKVLIYSFVVFLSLLLLQSCDLFKSSNSPQDENSNIPTKEINTDNGGNLKTSSGSEIIVPSGAVSKDENGNSGKVIFSIENNVPSSEFPSPIPNKYNLIGNVLHFGPSHFIFSYPVKVFLPASTLTNLDGVTIIWYSETEANWVEIPFSEIDATNKRLGVSVFELGYFAVVQNKETPQGVPMGSKIQEYHRSGGIKMEHSYPNDYYYTLMVQSFTPKYAEDIGTTYTNYTASTGSVVTGEKPLSTTYMVGLRPGTYVIIVSRTKAGSLFSPPGPTQYYSLPITVNVNSFSNQISWSTSDNFPWASLPLSGGDWQPGFPTIWPKGTVSLGTGELQITLSWTNTPSKIYTIDLFMYGPNNMVVSWHTPYSADGSAALDRTSTDGVGYAIRNIYSKKKLPSGHYKVYTNIWSIDAGSGAMPIEIQIIKGGKFIKKFRTFISTLNYEEEISKMLLVYEFDI